MLQLSKLTVGILKVMAEIIKAAKMSQRVAHHANAGIRNPRMSIAEIMLRHLTSLMRHW
jgi:hypothetical protein